MEPEARHEYVRLHLQLAFYWIWCKLTRQEFSYYPYDLPLDPKIREYEVVKSIPGLGITLYGKTFWITTPMALKYRRIKEEDVPPKNDNSAS
jgi:hypothetical protein